MPLAQVRPGWHCWKTEQLSPTAPVAVASVGTQSVTMREGSGPFRIGVGAQADGELLVAVLFSDGLVRVHRPDGRLEARFTVPGEPIVPATGAGRVVTTTR